MRNSCEQARERLSLQLDDELSAHEALLLERHLGRCSACGAFAADVRRYTQLLRATPLEPAPPLESVPALGLLRRPAVTRYAARLAAVTAAAAAAVLVAVSVVPVGSNHSGASIELGLWPTGLAVRQHGDGNLGLQRVAVGMAPATTAPAGGPRRGLLS